MLFTSQQLTERNVQNRLFCLLFKGLSSQWFLIWLGPKTLSAMITPYVLVSFIVDSYSSKQVTMHGRGPCHGSDGWLHTHHYGGLRSDPGHTMWDWWWTKWSWDRFFSEYFGFPLSLSFHQGARLLIFLSLTLCNVSSWQCL